MGKSIVSDYMWRIFQFAFKSIVPLFINFYGAKVLVPEKFGGVVYLLTILAVVNLFANFGFSAAVLKETAELAINKKRSVITSIFPSVSLITICLSILTFLILIVTTEDIPSFIYWSIPYVLFNPLTAILDGVFVGLRQFKKLAVGTVLVTVVLIPSSFLLINLYKETGIIVSYSLFYSLLFFSYYLFFPFNMGKIDKTLSLRILKYAVVVGIGSISFFLYTRVDILVLEKFNFITEIGNYEFIMRIFEISNIPIAILGQVLASHFVKLGVNKEFGKILRFSYLSATGLFIIGLVLAVILYYVIPFLLDHFYPLYHTDEFISIMKILLLTIPLKFVGIFMTNAIMTPLGYAKIISYSTLVFGIFNIILDVVFIKIYGFIGVFYVTLIVHNINIMLQYVIFYFKIRKKHD